MNLAHLPALVAYALATSLTPGPNNLMLLASGANFGFARTIPHMLGVSLGFAFMLALIGAGLVQVFSAYPQSYTVMQVMSLGYLLYLAWKIATAAPPSSATKSGTPFTFIQAALFQWVNPKAWIMGITAISLYAPSQRLGAVLAVALVFGAINLPSVGCWVVLGQQLRRLLTRPNHVRGFNVAMALLLLASVIPVVFR